MLTLILVFAEYAPALTCSDGCKSEPMLEGRDEGSSRELVLEPRLVLSEVFVPSTLRLESLCLRRVDEGAE